MLSRIARLFLIGLPAFHLVAAEPVGPRFAETASADDAPLAIAPLAIDAPFAERPSLPDGYGELPAAFEPNRGQAPAETRYLLRGAGYALLLNVDSAVLRTSNSDSDIVIRFPGAHAVEPVGQGLLPGKTNYYQGADEASWLRDIPNYESVRYNGLFPGVDLVFYAGQERLEYDFVVAPGADPAAVRLSISDEASGQPPTITLDGALTLATAAGEFRQEPPVLYQREGDARRPVNGSYRETSDGAFGFDVGEYDASLELVIDPILIYSTLVGGGSSDTAFSLAVDEDGAAYITGQTSSRLFPVTVAGTLRGSTDAFIVKLDPSGSQRVYSVYYGGSGNETGWDIEVDSRGRAVVSGTTDSTNLPRQNAFQTSFGGARDAFAVRLNESGGLIYSTYIGGSAVENGYGVASASDGTAYVTGETRGVFPVSAPSAPRGGNDAFVVKISPTGSRMYSQVIGGPGVEGGSDIAVDATGNVFVAGGSSRDFPSTRTEGMVGSPSDAIFFSLDPSGSPRFSLRMGGSGIEEFFRVAVASNGEIYLAGFTNSTNFPVRNPIQRSYGGGKWDATAVKLSASGAPLYATYLGGSRADVAYGGALGRDDTFYITGRTESSNFPVRPNAYQSFFGGGVQDAFVARLSETGSELLESTFIGGSSADEGYGVQLDGTGGLYVAGSTESNNFPTTVGAAQVVQQGGDAFVAKFSESNCRFSLSQSSRIVGAAGASDTITVNVSDPDCKWGASTDASFISISGDPGGTGTGSIAFEVAANPGSGVRRGAVLVAGRLVRITQFGTGCGFLVSPGNATVLEAGGERSVFVTASAPECSWSASSAADWLSFPGGASGMGDGVLTLRASSNSTGAGRTADILVGGEPFRVAQLSSACEISLSGVGGVRPQGGGEGRVKVISTGETCPWSASALDPWINIMSGSSGSGPGEVVYRVSENAADEFRTGELTVAGQPFTVVQNGEDTPDDNRALAFFFFAAGDNPVVQRCAGTTASLSDDLVDADGRTVQLNIDTDPDCNWRLTQDNKSMIQIQGSTSGVGDGSVPVRINAHNGPQERSGWIYVYPGTLNLKEVRVRQRARAGCNVDATPSAANVNAFGESRTLQVDADDNDCSWTVSAATENPWIEIPQGVAIGRGDGTVDYNVQANASRVRREGRIFVNQEREITIVQEGQPCDFLLTETERDIESGSFNGSVGVTTAPSDCQWGIFVNPGSDWIRISGPQTRLGGGNVAFEATANTSSSARMGFVQIAGINYTLRQAGVGVSCEYDLSATSASFSADASAGSFNLSTSASSCAWTAGVESGADWIRITSGLSGSGGTAVQFAFDANPNMTERVGVIRIAGLAFTVQQAGRTVGVDPPLISAGGVVEAARFQPVLVPGGLGTLFGVNFGNGTAAAEAVPLPTELAGIRVTVNGIEAALFFVNENQINFQVPTGLPTSGQYTVVVFKNGQASAPALVPAAEYAPAVYRAGPPNRETIATHTDGRRVTASDPIKAGQVFTVYLNGLGGLLNGAPTGRPAGASPLVTTRLVPNVTLGGAAVRVLFSGMTPGAVGLGQFNLEAPNPLPAGQTLDLLISFGAAVSPTAPLPVMQPPPGGNDDVAVEFLALQPATAAAGDNVRVDYRLSTSTGYRGNVSVDVYLSQDATIEPGVDRRLGGGIDGLQSNSAAFSQFFNVPADVDPGDYWVGVAIVSPADTNAVNDVSGARRLTVTGGVQPTAGVRLNSVSPMATGVRGPLDVDFTLTNSGPSAQVSYSIFISSDASITAADALVERGAIAVEGEASLRRTNLTLPAGLTPGAYFVGITATFVSGGPTAVSNLIGVELAQAMISGSLTANPNPIITCSSTGATNLSWTTTGVTAVQIRRSSPDGALVTSGGASGVHAVGDAGNGTTFYLQNTSDGLPLTEENTLDTVTVTITPEDCPPVGGPPPTTEITEGNLREWDFEAFEGGQRTSVGGRSATGGVKVGADYIVGFTTGGDKLRLSYPREASGVRVSWDLSGHRYLEFWVRGLVGSGELKLGSPVVRLNSGAGSRTIRPIVEIDNDDDNVFIFLRVPIDGDSDWIVSTGGFFSITGVTSIELEWESTGAGIQVGVDGLLFKP